MDKENITPEERLLSIIETPGKLKHKTFSGLSKTKIKGNLFKQISIGKNFFKQVNLHTINKIVIGLSVILTFYGSFDFIGTNIGLKKHLKKFVAEASTFTLMQKELPVLEANISEVLAGAKRRNIFSFIPPQPGEAQAIASAATQAANALSTLKLVGIIWSDKPQVMIEDTKEQKTYLLGQGDEISKFKIKKILKDKVMISKDEQEWELR